MARIPAGPARPPLRWLLGVALLTVLVGGGGLLPTASAATITVTTLEDQFDGAPPCSLREAIVAANTDTATGGCPAGSGADVIVLGAGTYHLVTSPFGSPDEEVGDLDVSTPITVNGAGAGATVVDGAWADEFETDRIFHVHADGNLTLNGVTVRDGEPPFDFFQMNDRGFASREQAHRRAVRNAARFASDRGTVEEVGAYRTEVQQAQPECDNGFFNPEDGGGIRVDANGTLTANDIVVDRNLTFEGVGGGLFVSCDGHADLTGVVFTRNFAGVGGGIHNDGFLTYTGGSIGTLLLENDNWPDRNTGVFTGGGLWNDGLGTLRGVDIFGNLGLFGAGGIGNGGTLTMERGTVFKNYAGSIFEQILEELANGEADADGGGIANVGGVRTLDLTNVTISQNATEGSGGGLYNEGDATANLNNVTIAFNRADDDNDDDGDGGGIFEQPVENNNSVNLRNTILAGNIDNSLPGDDIHPDCSGVMASQGNNLVQNTAGCSGLVGSDKTGVDPLLLPLADYGGDTLTHALAAASPAIDGGGGWAPIDQRGAPRPYGAAGDIGAYERVLCFGAAVNVVGTEGNDTLDVRLEPPMDVVLALGGNDTILTGPSQDRVCAGAGNDRILLGSGRDKGDGQEGNDILRGGGNPDLLKGGPGSDDLFGGGTLRDKGDNCKGGPGRDQTRGCERGRA